MQYTQNFSNPFLLDPDNIGYIEHHQSHYNRGLRRGLFFYLGLLAIIFGLAAFLSWRIWNIHNQYEQFGVSTMATVVSRVVSSGSRSTTYYLYYSYTVPGTDEPYQGKQDVDYDLYHQTQRGDKISVKYLSTDPFTSKIAGREADLIWYLVFGLVMAFSLYIIILIARTILRRNRLERTGRLLPGRLTQSNLQKKRTRYRVYSVLVVDYEFQNQVGKNITNQEKYVRNDLVGQPLPPPGTPLVILYADDRLYGLL